MEQFFEWLQSNPIAATVAIIAFAVLVASAPLMYIVAFFQGREISFWPPRIGARISTTETKKRLSIKGVPAYRTSQAPSASSVDPKLSDLIPPLEPMRFKIVNLPDHPGTPFFNWLLTPIGLTMVYQTPFFLEPFFANDGTFLGHKVIDIQPAMGNVAQIAEVPLHVEGVSKLHFLLSAGHGRAEHEGVRFLGKRIGYIELEFADGTSQRENLILGKHLREWAYGNPGNLVREVDYTLTKPAWVSHNFTRRIDYMSIGIEGEPKELSFIRVVAKFEEDPKKPISTPAIIISAITCERAQ
jgi:hypothetical protein